MEKQPIRILLAEDNPLDVELELLQLKRAGLSVESRIAITSEDFRRALREFLPDVVISDFSMPNFDGMEALQLTRQFTDDLPFIFVSGTLGEEYAIRALKNGATDYVLKTNLVRLAAAVERAIEGAETRRARRQAENGLQRAHLMAKLANVITGGGGAIESWSESLPGLIGVQADAMPRSTRAWLEMLHPEDREPFRSASINAAQSGGRTDVEYRLRRGDGTWIQIRQVIEPLDSGDKPGLSGRWFSTLQDVTEQKEASDAVRRLNRVYAVLSGINTLIVRAADMQQLFSEACEVAVKHGRFPLAWIGLANEDRTELRLVASAGGTGDYLSKVPMSVAGSFAGRAVQAGRLVVSNDIQNDPRLGHVRAQAADLGFHSMASLPITVGEEAIGVMLLYADQRKFFDDAEVRLLNELAGNISFAVDAIQKGKRLDFVSHYDDVTGLANRVLFMDRLGRGLSALDAGRIGALAVLDIERFRMINDSLGRPAGDALLARLAERLTELSGDPGRVARTGPDQFAVFMPNVRAVERVARAIDEGSRRVEGVPFEVNGTSLRIAVRSGIAVSPADGREADTLFRNAEAALKKAKEQGEKYLFYRQEMTERIAERLSLENRLRLAIEKKEFVLHYQPKVSLEDRRLLGLEALIRWQSAEGLVPPFKFIGILEETGLIGQVGAWALEQAADQRRAWIGAGLPAPRVAVNVSAIQLRHENFLQTLKEALGDLRDIGVDLEITESLLMDNFERTIQKLKAVCELGLEVAIDDFGTGYSSLSYLSKLPVHALKIDRSFVMNMDKDANAMTLVSTIISLAHSLRLKVIAEGVETETQANTLRLLRCDMAQGYFFSKPVPAETIESLLRGTH